LGLVNILMAGRGSGGSWQIRGQQLGEAIGAVIDPAPKSVKGYGLAIVVKRPRAETIAQLHKAKVPIVWDVVDAWPQPAGNDWDKRTCMEWLQREVDAIRPAGLVAATEAMAWDCRHLAMPVLALAHHARPAQEENMLREKVETVGYQGGNHLGLWQDIIIRQCDKRGWRFVADHDKAAPMSLASVDIVLAVRGQRGYAARQWKSNVKLANAQGSGTPSVVQRDAGYVETAGARQYFADNEQELSQAFDVLALLERRQEEVDKYRPPKLRHIAEKYADWLARVV
jgi:hypothetical protein